MKLDDITCVGVVGLGQMGSGIAQVAASAGWGVLCCDVSDASLQSGMQKIRDGLKRAVEKGSLTPDRITPILARLRTTGRLDDLAEAHLVIEAAPENRQLKADLFNRLGQLCKPETVLASNTSSISITQLGAASGRPDRVVGMHFMNPVPVMRLVEIVRGRETSDETIALAEAVAQRLGKVPVLSKDAPGFIVNRVLMPMINEAIFALQEGVATAEAIDLAMTAGTNQPVGPLALADRIGLDTVLAICEVLHQDLNDPKFRPCPLLRQYVEAGWLGRKTGRGFYIYSREA
ncbi:MAG: 3-hydroxyacyl-CoA dehydrogenase NAD-binding domain-containing protein [Nitrospirota bacterium]